MPQTLVTFLNDAHENGSLFFEEALTLSLSLMRACREAKQEGYNLKNLDINHITVDPDKLTCEVNTHNLVLKPTLNDSTVPHCSAEELKTVGIILAQLWGHNNHVLPLFFEASRWSSPPSSISHLQKLVGSEVYGQIHKLYEPIEQTKSVLTQADTSPMAEQLCHTIWSMMEASKAEPGQLDRIINKMSNMKIDLLSPGKTAKNALKAAQRTLNALLQPPKNTPPKTKPDTNRAQTTLTQETKTPETREQRVVNKKQAELRKIIENLQKENKKYIKENKAYHKVRLHFGLRANTADKWKIAIELQNELSGLSRNVDTHVHYDNQEPLVLIEQNLNTIIDKYLRLNNKALGIFSRSSTSRFEQKLNEAKQALYELQEQESTIPMPPNMSEIQQLTQTQLEALEKEKLKTIVRKLIGRNNEYKKKYPSSTDANETHKGSLHFGFRVRANTAEKSKLATELSEYLKAISETLNKTQDTHTTTEDLIKNIKAFRTFNRKAMGAFSSNPHSEFDRMLREAEKNLRELLQPPDEGPATPVSSRHRGKKKNI